MTAAATATETPAVGFSIQADLGAGMQLVLQTHVSRAEAMNGQLDTLLDRFHKAAERQRAKAEIEAMERHIEAHEKAIKDGDDRVAEAEKQYRKDVAVLEHKIGVWERDGAATEKDSRDAWSASNKRGDWKPPGAVQQRLDGYRKQIEDARKQLEGLNAAKDKAMAAERHAADVARQEIEKTRAKIEERRKLIAE